MQHSGSLPDSVRPLVCDASFWINLVATDRTEILLGAFGRRTAIPAMALAELERGRAKGRVAALTVETLVRSGTIDVVECDHRDEDTFLRLVAGSGAETLDDGEAATLVCALRMKAAAVIDERKATSLAAAQFPDLQVLSTIDLLLEAHVGVAIGRDEIVEAIYRALVGARMRVIPARLGEVATLLGPARLASCFSLPSRFRDML